MGGNTGCRGCPKGGKTATPPVKGGRAGGALVMACMCSGCGLGATVGGTLLGVVLGMGGLVLAPG